MGATLSAPNDLTWRKKKCGGVVGAENELRAERRERSGGGGKGDILLSFLMSFTAMRLTSRKGGRKGKGRKRGGKKRKNNINISMVRRFKVNAAICILNFEKKN